MGFFLTDRLETTVFTGRGTPEKVTCPASFPASAGPIPRTRSRPSTLPKAPNVSRLATIRPAIAGPIPRSVSISLAEAISRSRMGGTAGGLAGAARLALVRFLAPCRERVFLTTESTADLCSLRAAIAPGLTDRSAVELRYSRVAPPSTITPLRNISAFLSAGVATQR